MISRGLVLGTVLSVLALQGTASAEQIEGIEVQGSREFVLRTQQSLQLLQSTPQFAVVRPYFGAIRQGKRSGMDVYADPPTYEVGFPTWSHSALWYASTIAHDAYHSKLYHDYKKGHPSGEPPGEVWTGKEAERVCMNFQREVLVELKAGNELILYLDQLIKNPTYQGDPQSEEDYRRRSW